MWVPEREPTYLRLSCGERKMKMDHILDWGINHYRESIIADTGKLIRIKSVKNEPLPGMPFGRGIDKCLREALNICDGLGFRTKYCDGYAGYAEIGYGDEMVGILVHLDTVPAGIGWDSDPFAGEITDERIYGRGAIDDKGPAVAVIYAVKALMDSGLTLKRRVRIIFGTDEENKWECMDHYRVTEELPDLGFSPDAEYPVIFAEKGIMFLKLSRKFEVKPDTLHITDLRGGQFPNMVPDSCIAEIHVPGGDEKYVGKWAEAVGNNNVSLCFKDRILSIKACGLSAHGSTPERGINAVSVMMELLGTLDRLDASQRGFIDFYNERIGRETNGHMLIGDISDEISGSLVFNAGVLNLDKEKVVLSINIRFPVTFKGADIADKITQGIKSCQLELSVDLNSEPLYQEIDSDIVQTLLAVYRSFKDDGSEPLCIGGGTYARSMNCSVAFGPVFPGQTELAHCPNEYISIEDLILNARIYAEAIRCLAQ